MIFKEDAPIYASEIERKQEEDVLYVNFLRANFIPSLADNDEVMLRLVEELAENPSISRVIFVQQRNYSYSYDQIKLLKEISALYNFLVKHENMLSLTKLSFYGEANQIFSEVSYLVDLLKRDPVRCYFEIRSFSDKIIKTEIQSTYARFLERIGDLLEETMIIKRFLQKGKSSISDRAYYKEIFRADVLPNFSFTRLMSRLPDNAELIDQYFIGEGEARFGVSILKKKNDAKYFYHVLPPEYELTEEQHEIVNLARNVLSEHRPKAEEFTDPARTRQVFFNVAKDLVSELGANKGVRMNFNEIEKLARILVRHTIGYGMIEILLMDERLQDIVVNAPASQNPIFVRHEKFDECETNITPSFEDADSWAAKLRLQSGRPLDEANPILDTEIVLEDARARVAAVKEPLSPSGLAYAFRRHRDNPWTLPLFIKNGMINSLAAGLLSFLIDGNRTILF